MANKDEDSKVIRSSRSRSSSKSRKTKPKKTSKRTKKPKTSNATKKTRTTKTSSPTKKRKTSRKKSSAKTRQKKPVAKRPKASPKKPVAKKPKARPKKPRGLVPPKKPPKAPKGFTLGLGETSGEAYNTILARLEATRVAMGIGDVRVAINKDDSVDGEYAYNTIRGQPSHGPGGALFAIEQAFDVQHAVGSRYWLSIVFRFIADDDGELYRKWQGMSEVQTHYRRCTRTKMIAAFEAADSIVTNIESSYRRKVTIILVRMHWNPDNAKPQR